MKKIYKVKTGKELLKMIYKGKLKNQFVIEDFRGKDIIGFYIGTEHYSTGRAMTIEELLGDNTFYIYENNEENYSLLASKCKKYNQHFK